MYLLINNLDNSVNNASETPFPDFMVHEGLSRKEVDLETQSHLTEEEKSNVIDLFWKQDDSGLESSELVFRRINEKELQELIDQQQELQIALVKSESEQSKEKFNQIAAALIQLFPDNEQIKAILSDNEITQDELNEIENLLNS